MTYEEKLTIANAYLAGKSDFSWDDLSDINSLHDVDDKEGIITLCNDRLIDSGFLTDEDIDESSCFDDTEYDDDDDVLPIDDSYLY